LANIKSQIKRNHQNEKRRLRNRDFRGAARTAVKDARASLASGQDTPAAIMAAVSALDKAAQKGAIHARNAARRKGRLMKHLAMLGMQPAPAGAGPSAPAAVRPSEKKPAKAVKEDAGAKETKPAKESKAKAEAAKKAPAKKTADKKPAAKK
jgi:small subunit ribosomal protein S20